MDIEAIFGATALGHALSPRARLRLLAKADPLALSAGETSNCLECDGQVLLVAAGRLRVSRLDQGRVSFRDIAATTWSGLTETLAGSAPGPRAVLALDDSAAFAWRAADVVGAAKTSASAALALAVDVARAALADFAGADPLTSVYRDILRAAKPAGSATWTIDPMPRHRELALRSGVAEEDAAAAVAHLVRSGIARRRYPALDIADREELKRLAAG